MTYLDTVGLARTDPDILRLAKAKPDAVQMAHGACRLASTWKKMSVASRKRYVS